MTSKKLNRILEIKEKHKEEIERELKKERTELKHEKEKLKSLKSEFNSMSNLYNEDSVSSNLEIYYKFVHTLSKKIDIKENEVKEKSEIVNAKENELLNAYRETKALNILYDDVMKEEIKKVILGEQKNLDFDFITRKFRK